MANIAGVSFGVLLGVLAVAALGPLCFLSRIYIWVIFKPLWVTDQLSRVRYTALVRYSMIGTVVLGLFYASSPTRRSGSVSNAVLGFGACAGGVLTWWTISRLSRRR